MCFLQLNTLHRMPHVLFPVIPTDSYEGNLPVSMFLFRFFIATYLPSAVGWGTALQVGRTRVRFPMVSLEFFIDVIISTALCPGIDSASNRNEYQGYFLGGKGGRCVGLTIVPPSCADCLEIWEPRLPGILRARSGLFSDCSTFTYLPKYRPPNYWRTYVPT
jgi:hypothetical protein